MRQRLATHGASLEFVGEDPALTPRWLVSCPSNRVRLNERFLFIAASHFKQHEQETLDVRVVFTPY
jgi:hypothetical protein